MGLSSVLKQSCKLQCKILIEREKKKVFFTNNVSSCKQTSQWLMSVNTALSLSSCSTLVVHFHTPNVFSIRQGEVNAVRGRTDVCENLGCHLIKKKKKQQLRLFFLIKKQAKKRPQSLHNTCECHSINLKLCFLPTADHFSCVKIESRATQMHNNQKRARGMDC